VAILALSSLIIWETVSVSQRVRLLLNVDGA
jgi:hypothetical protein